MRKEKKMRNPLKIFWILLGFLCLGLGTIGIVLPILPTVPFYMGTLFCFAKSSERLHTWFTGTGLYKKHLYLWEGSVSRLCGYATFCISSSG